MDSEKLTPTQIQEMLTERFKEYPQLGAVASNPNFKTELARIVAFFDISEEIVPIIERNVLVVLSLYAPITSLPQNISEDTGINLETATNLATMIDTILFTDVSEQLYQFDILWKQTEANQSTHATVKESLELQPEEVRDATRVPAMPQETQKPLTRDELMQALAAKRTMQGDIAASKTPETTSPKAGPVHGYEAYRAQK